MRHAHFSPDRGDIYDAPVTMLAHVWQGRKRSIHRTPEHHSHCIFEIRDGHVLHWAYLDNAGIIHKHVNSTEAFRHLIHHVKHLLTSRDVAIEEMSFHASACHQILNTPPQLI